MPQNSVHYAQHLTVLNPPDRASYGALAGGDIRAAAVGQLIGAVRRGSGEDGVGHGLHLPIPAATPDIAVQTFYMVSGFYMALVLTERYHSLPIFFTNRLLRLYPAYLVVAAVTVAHALVRWSAGRESN